MLIGSNRANVRCSPCKNDAKTYLSDGAVRFYCAIYDLLIASSDNEYDRNISV